MPDTRCMPDYLPWLLAHDFNLLPDVDCKHELIDLGGDKYMIILGSHTIDSKVLIKYDQDWCHMTGMILIWSGSVASIPGGWQICDGTNGTPDLRNKFIIGAGDTYAPADSASTNVVADAAIE
ncbi:unnamed protein product, partial [marine sediment metagenome]